MTDQIFHSDLDADGVLTLSWDLPGKSMNVMTIDGLKEFSEKTEAALADDAVKAIVITSAKPDFAGGMDLNVLADMKKSAGDDPAQGLFDGTMEMHRILRTLELAGAKPTDKKKQPKKPVVWACPGTAAGIGLEIGLACHRRIVADNPKAKIGLPEILIGIFPGAGGTTRVSRMLGAMAAAPVLVEGKMVPPKAAKASGIVDEVVPAEELLARAKAWALEAKPADLIKPWDSGKEKIPGGAPYHPQGFLTYVGASAMIHGKTQGVYPAAKALLAAVYEGAQVDFDTALRIEARWFTNVLLNPSSEAMIRSIFLNKEALEKGATRPAGIEDQKVKKLGILGAGMMGAGIAYVSANAGIEVVLIDRDQDAADKGKAYSEGILDKAISRKRATPEKKAEVLGRITATDDFNALDGCDLVVEAVFEDPGVKAETTQKAEAVIPETAIFATNTSTLPITDLAKASARPDQFIGIHFFSPVDKMLLVEIIRGKETGDRAVAKALDFVRQIRKTPIVVNDARFFYANRCIIPYLNEGIRMVAEGVAPALVENAARQLGMPLGPLQLCDETSIDLGVKIAKATRAALGDAYDGGADPVLFTLFDLGRLGRKSKAGFYAYDDKGKRQGLWEGLDDEFPAHPDQPDVSVVQQRLLLVQVLEAVRALEEGVLMDIREGDVGAILGWGFAPWSGGPLSWLDMIGTETAALLCDELSAEFGERFACPALLREMAEKGESFYGRFGPETKAAA